jgi:hypothetical protein
LVDEIGSFEDAIKITGELAGITGRPVIVEPARPFSLTDLIRATFRGRLAALVEPVPTIRLNYLWTWG